MTNFIKENGKNRVKNWANIKKAKILCKRIKTGCEQVFIRVIYRRHSPLSGILPPNFCNKVSTQVIPCGTDRLRRGVF